MKNLTDFRKTVETGVDPRLFRYINGSGISLFELYKWVGKSFILVGKKAKRG